MTEGVRRATGWALAAAVALALSGCASTRILPGRGQASAGGASRAQVAVVKAWSEALRAGHVRRAASYFRLPSVFTDGVSVLQLRTRLQAEVANASLSCGAQFVSAVPNGRYLDVLFRLVARPGTGGGANACGSGVGQTARTDFLIENGKIVAWLRAPSQPGDPGVPTTPSTPGSGGGSTI